MRSCWSDRWCPVFRWYDDHFRRGMLHRRTVMDFCRRTVLTSGYDNWSNLFDSWRQWILGHFHSRNASPDDASPVHSTARSFTAGGCSTRCRTTGSCSTRCAATRAGAAGRTSGCRGSATDATGRYLDLTRFAASHDIAAFFAVVFAVAVRRARRISTATSVSSGLAKRGE